MENFTPQKTSLKKILLSLFVFGFIVIVAYVIYAAISIPANIKKMAVTDTKLYYPPYPAVNTVGSNADVVKRGEYLTKAGDCIACHTNTAEREKSKPFAGGLAMPTPFGTLYTPNITPDKETGIGSWTEEQFANAMTHGISPQGSYYYPAFPFMYFNRFTPEDIKAIKAYLDSIPAVSQPNRTNEMMFPFNWRFLQLGWRILFFNAENTGPYKINAQKSEEWNRGAYLVDGAGHCAMCHSPSYNLLSESLPLGAPIRKYDLTGAKVQGYLAPNITKSNIGKATDQEVMEVFTKDKLIGGGNVVGPMQEVNHDSLIYLTEQDLLAISRYLKTVESESPPKPKAGNGGPGKGTYETYCSGCHTMGAGGAPKLGDSTSWTPLLKTPITEIDHYAIYGIRGMPAKGTCLSCSDEEIKQAVDYMVGAVKGESSSNAHPAAPAPKKLTLADGKRLYTENCAVCHNSGFKNAPKPGDVKAWEPIVANGFYDTYKEIKAGHKGHLPQGACPTCSDEELIAALKYMMQSSAPGKDYSLW
ncbi:MAG: c-type cytochrome [Gammaproteobacteria bacterium]|nr:c-type cytochrome [Gammaproteobacteria bacterium]